VNEVKWLKSLTRDEGKLIDAAKDSVQGRVSADFEFPVYSQSGVFKKMNGTIRYRIVLEAKDGKYRYTFSDFIYSYYKQDRTYKMSPTGMTKMLEETEASGWKKLWTQHRKTVAHVVDEQIAALKTQIIERPTASEKKPSEKKIDW
jgi:hypothetical protein